jgi:hypothetical protein
MVTRLAQTHIAALAALVALAAVFTLTPSFKAALVLSVARQVFLVRTECEACFDVPRMTRQHCARTCSQLGLEYNPRQHGRVTSMPR